jgi:hypothetical protein
MAEATLPIAIAASTKYFIVGGPGDEEAARGSGSALMVLLSAGVGGLKSGALRLVPIVTSQRKAAEVE